MYKNKNEKVQRRVYNCPSCCLSGWLIQEPTFSLHYFCVWGWVTWHKREIQVRDCNSSESSETCYQIGRWGCSFILSTTPGATQPHRRNSRTCLLSSEKAGIPSKIIKRAVNTVMSFSSGCLPWRLSISLPVGRQMPESSLTAADTEHV